MMARIRDSSLRVKLLLAFAAVYVIWGSTYLAILIAIESLPPLSMAGVRFMLAGAALYAFMRLRGAAAPEPRHWRSAAVIGGLLLLCGNGGVVLAERTVPSGVVALLVAMVPMWMVLLEWVRPGGTRPARRTLAGLVVGFAGLVLLVGPDSIDGRIDPLGVGLVTFGALAWAAGSIYSRAASLPRSAFLATGMEMACGGAWLLAAGILRGELATMDPAGFTLRSIIAFVYLLIFGSLVGFTAYIWLLGHTTAAKASTYAYVNPVVAVLLGWALAGEPMSGRVLAAAAVIIGAVALITLRRRTPVPPTPVAGPPAPAPAPERARVRRR